MWEMKIRQQSAYSMAMTSKTVHSLKPADVEHREAFKEFVVDHAEEWHQRHLGCLYQAWETWNEDYFDGAMTPPYILLSEPSSPRRLGDCGPISGFGGRSQIRIRPSLLTGTHPLLAEAASEEGRRRFVKDVLLHEMIHQWQQEVTGEREQSYHGHGRTFRDKCNEIGTLLGLPAVGMKPRNGQSALPQCTYWPLNVRDANYYLDAVKPTLNVEVEDFAVIATLVETNARESRSGKVEELVRYILQELRTPEIERILYLLDRKIARLA